MTVPCDRDNILNFIHHVRSKLPQRTAEGIDRQIREERDSWDNDEYPDWTTEELMQLSMQGLLTSGMMNPIFILWRTENPFNGNRDWKLLISLRLYRIDPISKSYSS
jgi:hypothetical protein